MTTLTDRQNKVKNKTAHISCIVPMHNEAEGIKAFVHELTQHVAALTSQYEIILIDDGSKDETVNIVENELLNQHVKLLTLSRNFGKEKAITAGLEHCSGEVAIIIDSDFQHPFSLLPTFLEKWAEGYDMPYGVRRDREDEKPVKRLFANLFYRLLGHLSEVRVPSDAGDFRLLDRKVIDALNECDERSRFMKGLYAWVGYKSIAIPYKVQERQSGKSSWSFFRLVDLALTGIISFSDMPLRVWSIIGACISGIAFIYALFIVFKTLVFGVDVPGYATIVVAIMFFGGVQLLSIGILGEYLARVFREVKNRPQYLIDKKHGFDDPV